MSRRRLYLDQAPGETRAVVTLDGRPERFFLERIDDGDAPQLDRRYAARLARIEQAIGAAFLDLGDGFEALAALTGEAKTLTQGALIEVEIIAEARRGKLAQARVVGAAQGAPGALGPRRRLLELAMAHAPSQAVTEGAEARDLADEAESQILALEHALPGGGSLAIEPTRALVAIDVDLGARAGDPRRAARQANLTAIAEAARLLRLKGLGGLIVFDLVGAGHDGPSLGEAARRAFAPDEPGVGLGPISRFGLLQIATPWRITPLAERLCDPRGVVSAATVALRLMRALEREGRADGGARLIARCAPLVAAAAAPYAEALKGRIGPRFELRAEADRAAEAFDVSPR